MPQLRIVMVSPYPVKLGMVVGGIEAVASTLAPAIAALDAVEHVTVLCFHHSEVPVHNVVLNDKLAVRYLRGQDRLAVLTRSILEVLQTRRIVAELQPHIVHGQEIGWCGDVATQSSPNSVVTVHGLVHREKALSASTKIEETFRLSLLENMVKRVLARAKVTISISKYDAAAIGSLVGGHHVHIPNPINSVFFNQPRSQATEQRVLFAGVHVPRKNIEGLLEAFALTLKHAPAAQLALVGPTHDAAYVNTLYERAIKLNLSNNVQFIGHIENTRMIEEMQRSRVVALFSHEETAPTVLAQAMALGKPVVATRVGGIPEMVTDGVNGFLVKPGAIQDFAERLAVLLRSPDLSEHMGAAGAAFARQHLTPGAVAQRTVEAYRLVTNSSISV